MNFELVVYYDGLYMTGIGYASFVMILELLHILRYSKTIADLTYVLCRGAWDMTLLGFWGFSILLAFSALIYW